MGCEPFAVSGAARLARRGRGDRRVCERKPAPVPKRFNLTFEGAGLRCPPKRPSTSATTPATVLDPICRARPALGPLRAVKATSRSQWNDGVDDARAASGSMKSGGKMVVVRATV
jgi:hypothetical protein